MSWVTCKKRFGSYLALVGLALQLILSFGHLHLDRLSSGSAVATVAAASVSGSQPLRYSIPRTMRATIVRFAPRSISPRTSFLPMRRCCRCRSLPDDRAFRSCRLVFCPAATAAFQSRAPPRRLNPVVADLTLRRACAPAKASDERGNLIIFDLPRQRDLRLSRPFGHLLQQSG